MHGVPPPAQRQHPLTALLLASLVAGLMALTGCRGKSSAGASQASGMATAGSVEHTAARLSTPVAIGIEEGVAPPTFQLPTSRPTAPGTGGAAIADPSRGNAATDPVNRSNAPIRWQWPTTSRLISDPFGLPRGSGYHTGIDIVDKWKAPIWSAAPGVVIWAGDEGATYGLSVVIQHPNGWLTRYAHLSGIYPEQNDRVQAGQLIGQMGDSGYAFGTHLHFEVIADGRYIDPLSVLERGT
jgi:murein DD-endopeptidase MepM/ murein hydrolase activator NlpD